MSVVFFFLRIVKLTMRDNIKDRRRGKEPLDNGISNDWNMFDKEMILRE